MYLFYFVQCEPVEGETACQGSVRRYKDYETEMLILFFGSLGNACNNSLRNVWQVEKKIYY